MAIPEKLENIKSVKAEIRNILNTTNQNTNVPFRQYCDLIENITESGAMTLEQVNSLTRQIINISGEEA